MKHIPTRITKSGANAAHATKSPAREPHRPDFTPVPVRHRDDGWTPERQIAFIDALAQSACVAEAAAHVGMSVTAAYKLRARPDAHGFRAAWQAALDHAVLRLSDAAFSRALNGVARPVFYQGEQVGERRYYDERLTMFILRYRDPARYGAWMDAMRFEPAADGPANPLAGALDAIRTGDPVPPWPLSWSPPVPIGRDLERERRDAALAAQRAAEKDQDIMTILAQRLDAIERRRAQAKADAEAAQQGEP